MRIDILTLFPGMFLGPFQESIMKRAQERGLVELHLHDIRDFTDDRHHVVDDYPYGGGAGMVMKPEPVFRALEEVRGTPLSNSPPQGGRGLEADSPPQGGRGLEADSPPQGGRGLEADSPPQGGKSLSPVVILMTPQGEVFNQRIAQELSGEPWLVLLCGHYEGVDERIREHMVDREISIGDYILTGGEIPAIVLCDAVVRLLPGVMGCAQSAEEESFAQDLLEYPQYTRPADFQGWTVPDVLLSGNHGAVAKWRREQALLRTAKWRPELMERAGLTPKERAWLLEHLRAADG